MAITEQSRAQLNQVFRAGARPNEEDFGSAWLSCINKIDDGVDIDVNGNLELTRGITIRDATGGEAGTLRFNGGQLQFHDGTSFNSVSTGASGAFLPVGGGPSVAFGLGNVGIGNFAAAPTHRLEITLADNTAADQRVRVGNLAIHNGAAATPGAYVCHTNQGGNANSYALFQDSQGNTRVNAALNTELTMSQNADVRVRVNVTGGLELLPLTTVNVGSGFVPRDLNVFGNAFKPGGGPFTALASDARVKKDVKPFQDGLAKVLALEPVQFRFNGKGETSDDGINYIGLIAQELQKVLPDLILSRSVKLNEQDDNPTDILTYDQGPIIFVLINAIKELAGEFEKLKKSLTNEKRKPKNPA